MGAWEVLEPWLSGPAGHVLAAVLGALFGSFANVCIYRMPPSDEFPAGRSIAHPPSHCSACKAPIAWYDNVPLLAYLWLRGRCRHCQAEFSPRYLLVEGATALLFVAVFHLELVTFAALGEPTSLRLARFAIAAAFVFVLVVITFIDLDHKLILDRITYPAIPLFYLAGLALPERRWFDGVIGAAVGYGVIRLLSDGYFLLTRRRGLGYGDGKLLAMVGALFGWPAVAVALFGGSLLGTVLTLGYLGIVGRQAASAAPAPDEAASPDAAADPAELDAAPPSDSIRHLEIPFGPYLAAGAIAFLFLEPWIRLKLSILYG
jgi:leader peptidase (prepilin peptidase)/N-methyltransferase